jgi:type I restriction enzyme, S subunit
MSKQTNISKGYKQSPLGLIPVDWEVKYLSKLGDFSKGKGILKEQVLNEGLPCIRYGEIYTVYDLVARELNSFISKEVAKESQEIKNGAILFAGSGETIGEIGKAVAYLGNQVAYAGGDVIILSTNKKVNAEFLSYALNTNIAHKQKRRLGQGQQVVHIYPTDLAQIKILLSPLPEQTAIANLLSTWDKAIQTTNQLIAQKEQRKKWLMQQLLTGKKRLKGFGGEWREYHLGSLGDTYTGLSGKNKEDFGVGKPYIPYLNIFNNAKIDVSNFDYVNITDTDNQNKVKYGDIFFTVSSETPDEVGMASVMLDNIDELYLNSFCFGFRLYDFNTLAPEFSSYFLRADKFRAEIYKLSQGATRFNLSKNNLMKLNILLPPIKEQTAIATVLQTADKEIQLLKAKAEALKEQKKGLMQQLLTGKKRLKIKK